MFWLLLKIQTHISFNKKVQVVSCQHIESGYATWHKSIFWKRILRRMILRRVILNSFVSAQASMAIVWFSSILLEWAVTVLSLSSKNYSFHRWLCNYESCCGLLLLWKILYCECLQTIVCIHLHEVFYLITFVVWIGRI